MPMPFNFEMNEKERKEAMIIAHDMGSKLKNALDGKIQVSMENFEEWKKGLEAIYEVAHPRSIEYFSNNPSALIDVIKEETISKVYVVASSDTGEIPNYVEEEKQSYLENLSPYLDILKNKLPKVYNNVIKFINNTFDNRHSILVEEKDKELPFFERMYTKLPQDNMLNDFKKTAQLKESRGQLQLWAETLTYRQGNIIIQIPHYEELLQKSSMKGTELNTPVKKLLDIATALFRETHSAVVKFSLDDYMSVCGLKDKKEARKQVNSALDVLYDISISYDDSKNKDRSRNYRDMRLVDDKGIERGIIRIRFAGGFAEELEKMPLMPYPLRLLKLSQGREHRNSFYIASWLCVLKNMNAGKNNEYIISVKSLLNHCPFLPTEEEVRSSGFRSLRERIINPFIADFEEALNVLGIGEDGYEWHYEGGKEIPFDKLTELDYETFINAYIRLDEWFDYPEISVLENKEKRRQEALKASKKKSTGKSKKS